MMLHYFPPLAVSYLFEAYYDCRKNKRNKAASLAFEQDLEANLMKLYWELRGQTWRPSPATVFVITHPKPREVWAANFRDRIVHHLVYRAIGPLFEKSFIHDSCACIKGRGALYGAQRMSMHLRSATQNWTKKAFVLKADVANFFGSIRQDLLFDMLQHRVQDEFLLYLLEQLVFQDVRAGAIIRGDPRHLAAVPPHKSLFRAQPGVGLPIGNLSSQFFANVYLDSLDQMVKRRLGMRRYVRYVDDFVLVHESSSALTEAADVIREHLAGLGMQLAERKTSIFPADRGLDFVGHVIRPHRASGRAKTHRHAIRMLEEAPGERLWQTCNSYLGLFRHAGSRKQSASICQAALRRGLSVDSNLTKSFKPC